MADLGLELKGESGSRRMELTCEHHNGLLYVVPSEATWVCSEETLHVHALAGFFEQLAQLDDVRIREVMQRWGLYFRERPLVSDDQTASGSD